jgi:hypothetical protein
MSRASIIIVAAVPPGPSAGQASVIVAAPKAVQVLRQAGYEVAEDPADDDARFAAATSTGRYRLRRPYALRP